MTKNDRFLARYLPFLCIAIYAAAASLGAFTGGLWASLGLGAAVIFWFGFWINDDSMPLTPRDLTLFALASLGIMAAELPFSVSLAASAKVWLQLATIFLPLLFLSSKRLQQGAASPYVIPVTALAMFCGAGFLWLELTMGGPLLHLIKRPDAALTEYNRGMAHLVLLAFPVMAGLVLSGGRFSAMALAALLLLPASLTESHTAKLALILGGIVILIAQFKPLSARRLLAAGSVIVTGWPLYARLMFEHFYDRVEAMPHSFLHREEIWDYLSYRIAEKPIFGWGLGTTHLLDIHSPHSALYRKVTQAAPHAHNFVMTLWVETGLTGILLGLAFLFLMLRKIAGLDHRLQPYAYGCFTASLVVAAFGFDFWTDSLWAAFALSAFLFGMMQQSLQGGHNRLDIEIV